jgi:hypothetical protein
MSTMYYTDTWYCNALRGATTYYEVLRNLRYCIQGADVEGFLQGVADESPEWSCGKTHPSSLEPQGLQI